MLPKMPMAPFMGASATRREERFSFHDPGSNINGRRRRLDGVTLSGWYALATQCAVGRHMRRWRGPGALDTEDDRLVVALRLATRATRLQPRARAMYWLIGGRTR